MKKVTPLVLMLLAIGLVIVAGCAGGKVTVDQAYRVLKPVKQLELPRQVAENLVIIIDNVADETSSYKNHVDLYVNDKLVLPNWAVSNVERTFTYRLKLKPGYYKVRADYFAYVGWGEEKYPILAEDLVRVTHDKKTILRCKIAKQPNGEPVNKKMFFKVETEPLVIKK